MIVSCIHEISKKQCRVIVDESFAFVLYKGELHKYGISEGEELKEPVFCDIMEHVLPKRAKLRAMNLLKKKMYTEKELTDKLLQGGYPESVVSEAIAYVKDYHYIDDLAYVQEYIRCYGEKSSRKEIQYKLLKKGIDKNIFSQVMEEQEENGLFQDENTLIKKLLIKKKWYGKEFDNTERQRIYGFFYRKGFSTDKVEQVMRESILKENPKEESFT